MPDALTTEVVAGPTLISGAIALALIVLIVSGRFALGAIRWIARGWSAPRGMEPATTACVPSSLTDREARILAYLLDGERVASELRRTLVRQGEAMNVVQFYRTMDDLGNAGLVSSRDAILAFDGTPVKQRSYALTDDGYDLAAGLGLGSRSAG